MNIPPASFLLPMVRRHKHLTCPSHTLIIAHIIFHNFVGRSLSLSLDKFAICGRCAMSCCNAQYYSVGRTETHAQKCYTFSTDLER